MTATNGDERTDFARGVAMSEDDARARRKRTNDRLNAHVEAGRADMEDAIGSAHRGQPLDALTKFASASC